MSIDHQIRLAVFNWLKTQSAIYGGVLPRKVLENGFNYYGQRVTLVGPAGIWKPRQMELPVSITTVIDGPYDDAMRKDGFLSYKYRGTDPYHRDNVGLRKAMKTNTPLVYFVNLVKGQYLANFPAFIIGENIDRHEFTVAMDEERYLTKNAEQHDINDPTEYYRRKYQTTLVKQRTHQQGFRIRVLAAYDSRCCLCRLNHTELLDAAHIIPDNEPMGDPIVQNGLTLCKIHHSAFDVNIIGISPDYNIHIRKDILHEIDGPMLKHGLQELNKQKINLPSGKRNYPDKERLELRFQRFMNAG